jgi:hypothetical protein
VLAGLAAWLAKHDTCISSFALDRQASLASAWLIVASHQLTIEEIGE